MNRHLAPPSGEEPPRNARRKDGSEVSLEPLAREVCNLYFAEFPDHVERYGTAGDAWCVHDTLHLLAWAIDDHDWNDADIKKEVGWLANVLEARDFPVERLARHLELAAAIVCERLDADLSPVLRDAATHVRNRRPNPPAPDGWKSLPSD